MSWNLRAKVRQEGYELNRVLELNRANVGFTGTATITKGDFLHFDDVMLEVTQIDHHHQIPHGDKAPCTIVWAENMSPLVLTDEDEITLRRHGFK